MLEAALNQPTLPILIWTALALGFLHTILGPDHYIPFVMMAKSENWSSKKTTWITFLCGLGHVASSILIAGLLILLGHGLASWETTSLAGFHDWRGSLAAWLLMGFGAAYGLWGLRKAYRAKPHTHFHLHEDGTAHVHEHKHESAHVHIHKSSEKKLTPWVLFTIFVFGPCESLIPLILASWALGGFAGTVWVSSAFAFSTVFTILVSVGLLLSGLSFLPQRALARFSHALAGLSLIVCGASVEFLGL